MSNWTNRNGQIVQIGLAHCAGWVTVVVVGICSFLVPCTYKAPLPSSNSSEFIDT